MFIVDIQETNIQAVFKETDFVMYAAQVYSTTSEVTAFNHYLLKQFLKFSNSYTSTVQFAMLQNSCFRTVLQFFSVVCLHWASGVQMYFKRYQQCSAQLLNALYASPYKRHLVVFFFNISPSAESRKPDDIGLPFQSFILFIQELRKVEEDGRIF